MIYFTTQIACCGWIDLLINHMTIIDVNCAFDLVSYRYQNIREKRKNRCIKTELRRPVPR